MNIEKINKIVWFIPVRRLRDKIRNILIYRMNKIYFKSLFKYEKNKYRQKEIFKYNVNVIEIETHSFCNRRCWFCPNSIVDRHSENIELDEELYMKIINELSEINYSNIITFHRFNEPLSYKKLILKRIKQAREKLPNAKLSIFTNGDYLTTEYLEELLEAGISYIIISYYLKENENFNNLEELKINMEKNIYKLNLEFKNFTIKNPEFRHFAIKDDNYIYYELGYKNLNIIYKATDFSKLGSSRGGIIKKLENIEKCEFSCIMPLNNVYIDYNGMVMPCCDLRSDIKDHQNMIIGNISKNTIFEIFTSEKTSQLRNYLFKKSFKLPPCNKCGIYQK